MKIRGQRIEVGEIEAALTAIEAVGSATVIAHGAGVETRLVAYMTPENGCTVDELDPSALRTRLAGTLPAHLVPSALVVLPELPITANGKLDRAALPVPDATDHAGREPQSPAELSVARAFRAALDLDDTVLVGVDSDFFALGGHSLSATRVLTRLNAEHSVSLSLRSIFETPTVGTLAAAVEGARPVTHRPRVGDTVRPDPLPASYGQQSLWMIEQLTGVDAQYNVPTVLRLRGQVDALALAAAVADLVRRHEALRTLLVPADTVTESDAAVYQRIVETDSVADHLDVALDDCADPVQAQARVAEFGRRPFRLDTDLPLRALILRTAADECVLVLSVHHAAIDDWSFPTLMSDLSTAYRARRAGHEPGWPMPEVQYADYAVWQRRLLGSADDPDSVLAEQSAYWARTLDEAPVSSSIALDRPRPTTPNFHGAQIRGRVDAGIAEALHVTAERAGVSMFMVAQAAVVIAMQRLGAGDDIVVGSPVGGRTDEALASVVGYFVNTLPLRHDLSGDPTVDEVLGRVREVVLGGFAHQDLPFEEIVRASGAERVGTHNPFYQVMLAYRADSGDLAFGAGLDSVTESADLAVVKADLEISVSDTGAGLDLAVDYATELFEAATAGRFVAALSAAFGVLAGAGGVRLSAVDVVPVADRVLVAGFAAGGSVPVESSTLDELLALSPGFCAGSPAGFGSGSPA
ncbi:condensation domain-containing protein, partial [Rhodococcus phenolicus]|uniref:condensation domain-containing protein n=1 Tax=Rhodococcus phenolicus TaxID=263849 RepID=UPI001FE0D584